MIHDLVNILMVKGAYDRAGGPETLLAATVRSLDRARFPATLVLLKKSGHDVPMLDEIAVSTAERRDIPWSGLLGAARVGRALAQLCAEKRRVLLHTHDMRSNLAAYLARRRCRVPWIAHVHGWLGGTHRGRWRIYEAVDRRLVRCADLVAVGSIAAAREVTATGAPRVVVIPNSIEIPTVLPSEPEIAEIRRKLNIPSGRPLLGVIGRVHPGKGQTVFINALSRLRARGVDFAALIVGDGPDLPAVQSLIESHKLQGHVVATGYCQDALGVMAAMDVVVVPSLKESLPLTALEAMVRARAVIASRVGDLPDVIDDGSNGRLVPPGNIDSLADTLDELIKQPAMRRRLGERARETVIERYSIAAMTHRLESAYEQVLAEWPCSNGNKN